MSRTSLLVVVFLSLLPCPVASQDTERLYQQACNDGDMEVCNLFGLMYSFGDGVPLDLSRAFELYQRACEGGFLVGCTNLGLMYETGAGVTQDIARANGLYQVACEGGELLGCAGLGGVEQTGGATPAERFAKSGRVGDPESGELLGETIVEVPELGIRVISDALGRIELTDLPRGRYSLLAEHAGYDVTGGELEVPGDPEFFVFMSRADLDDPRAPGRVSGRVTEDGRNRALSNVDIMVQGRTQMRTLSNWSGRFNLTDLQPGLTEIRFTRLGYAPRTATLIVQPGRTVELSATMFTEPIELDPIEVTVRSRFLEQSGFYRRAERGRGRQFTRDNLDAIDPYLVSDVLRRVPGIATTFDALDPNRVYAASRRSRSITLGPCTLSVFIDDVRMFDPDLNQLHPDQIEAMEVYLGVGTPLRYSRDSCGAVLIWTRRGR